MARRFVLGYTSDPRPRFAQPRQRKPAGRERTSPAPSRGSSRSGGQMPVSCSDQRLVSLPPYLHLLEVPTPFPIGPVNLYLAEGDYLTLVDTGACFPPGREALRSGLAALGYAPAELRRIVLSHTHSDHSGLAAELAQASGAQVLTHPTNYAQLADYAAERERRLAFYAALMEEAGMPPEMARQIEGIRRSQREFAQPVQPTGPLEEGMTIRLGDEDWKVLHTPGHAGGLICLYQPQRRLLLSSDHLLADVSSNPIVEPPEREGQERPRRLMQYVVGLQRVAELPIATALPGHGRPVHDPQRLIATRLSFHRRRARQVQETLRQQALSVYAITMVLFPRLDPMNRFLAVSEVIGHLEWLQAQGKVDSRVEGAVRLWYNTNTVGGVPAVTEQP